MKRVLMYVMFCCLLFSCSLQDDSLANFQLKTLPIKKVEIAQSFDLGSTQTIKIIYDLPDSCHQFYEITESNNGSATIFTVTAQVIGETDCNTVVKEETREIRFKAAQTEDYIFKFWKGRDSSGNDMFIEMTIPVNNPT